MQGFSGLLTGPVFCRRLTLMRKSVFCTLLALVLSCGSGKLAVFVADPYGEAFGAEGGPAAAFSAMAASQGWSSRIVTLKAGVMPQEALGQLEDIKAQAGVYFISGLYAGSVYTALRSGQPEIPVVLVPGPNNLAGGKTWVLTSDRTGAFESLGEKLAGWVRDNRPQATTGLAVVYYTRIPSRVAEKEALTKGWLKAARLETLFQQEIFQLRDPDGFHRTLQSASALSPAVIGVFASAMNADGIRFLDGGESILVTEDWAGTDFRAGKVLYSVELDWPVLFRTAFEDLKTGQGKELKVPAVLYENKKFKDSFKK